MARDAEIIARLRLNGEQFAPEANRIFGAMEASARAAGEKIEGQLGGRITRIQEIASRAVSIDIAGLKESAANASATAAGLKTLADAADRVAAKANGLDSALNAQAAATRNAALASEKRAATLMEEARAMDLLQAEMGQGALAIERTGVVARGAGGSFAMAGAQVQDFAIQVAGGQNPMMAFAQQAGQMSFALQGTGGKLEKVAAFLGGPWGVGLTVGITVLAGLTKGLWDNEDATEKAAKKLAEKEQRTREAKAADEAYAASLAGTFERLVKLTEEFEKQNRTIGENTRLKRINAQGDVQRTQEDEGQLFVQRLALDARLRRAQAQDAKFQGKGVYGEAIRTDISDISAELAGIDVRLAEARRMSAAARREANLAGVEESRQLAREAVDPIARITRQYDEMAAAAIRAAGSNRKLADSLTGTLSDIERRRAKALADARESGRSSTSTRSAPMQLLSPVDGSPTSEFGPRARPTAGASTFHKGRDFAVPVGTPVRAGADGVVIKTGTAGGLGKVVWIDYGNGVIAEFNHLSKNDVLKEGTTVRAGETVALSGNTGVSTGPHLDYRLRVRGAYVDPRQKVRLGAGAGDAMGDYERDQQRLAEEAAREAKRQQDAREKLLVQAREQLALEVETNRYFGLRAAGLGKEADLEQRIGEIRRNSAEYLAQASEGLSDTDRKAFLDSESKVSDAFREKLVAVEKQGDAYTEMLVAIGDIDNLTEGARAAIVAQNTALADQLEGAKALAKTAGERKLIEEAIARLQGKIAAAPDARGEGYGPKQQQAFEEMNRLWEEDYERQQDNIARLADFYEDAFNSGGKSIWKQFKDEGKRALAVVAAQYTLALLSGQKVSLGGLLSQMGAVSGAGGGFGGGAVSGILGLFGGSRAGPIGSSGQTNSVSSVIPMPGADFGSIFKGGMGEGGALGSGSGGGIAAGSGGIGTGLAIGLVGSALLGGKSGVVGQLGGSLGGIAGQLGGVALGKALGMAGSVAGPIGAIVGTLAGTLLGGLIGKPKSQYGTASLSSVSGSSALNSRGDGFGSAATGAGKSVQDALGQIIEQLGGTAGGFNVSIGQYKDSWRVNTNGYTGGGLNFKGTSANGLHDFGQDQEAAIRFAIQDALNDGAVKGISDASLRILKAGGDLDASLKKALAIESIPKRLKQMTDPVGYAIDELNKKWAETVAALKEGGASAEQMADAQKLYKLELAETKASARDATEGLKAFLKSIDFGSASPYSLRDQRAKAEAELAPYLASIAKGEAIDTGKFTDAAQAMLELERQLFGSTGQYFDSVDKIRNATNAAISSIETASPNRSPDANPFAEATASNTATANELLDQLSKQTATSIALLQSISGRLGSAGGGFVGGSSRQFAQVQLV